MPTDSHSYGLVNGLQQDPVNSTLPWGELHLNESENGHFLLLFSLCTSSLDFLFLSVNGMRRGGVEANPPRCTFVSWSEVVAETKQSTSEKVRCLCRSIMWWSGAPWSVRSPSCIIFQLFWSRVTGATAWAGWPRHVFPQPPVD